MADPINDLIAQCKSDIQAAIRAGSLKDGNIPVRNVWDNLEWANPTRHHLPLIQFMAVGDSETGYLTQAVHDVGFTIQFICWVERGANAGNAWERARDLRNALITALHNRRTFEREGANRSNLRIRREDEEYDNRFAIGAGLYISGNMARGV